MPNKLILLGTFSIFRFHAKFLYVGLKLCTAALKHWSILLVNLDTQPFAGNVEQYLVSEFLQVSVSNRFIDIGSAL